MTHIIILWVLIAMYNAALMQHYFTNFEHFPLNWKAFTMLIVANILLCPLSTTFFHAYLIYGITLAARYHTTFYEIIQKIRRHD